MDDICTYTIQFSGPVSESEINAICPLPVTPIGPDSPGTVFTVRTDQSGLVGLIRCLHGMGLVFLSICREGAQPVIAGGMEAGHDGPRNVG